eukprot:4856292-Prymnesium_polylepis.1
MAMRSARTAAARPPCEQFNGMETTGLHAIIELAARLTPGLLAQCRLLQAGAAREPVASAKP